MESSIIYTHLKNPKHQSIVDNVLNLKRINLDDALYLYETAPLHLLGYLANFIREKKHGNNTYFNRNFHIEPTNVCVFDCKFCSYSRLYAHKEEGWILSLEQMLDIVRKYPEDAVTEVHIVGGVHPKMNLYFFAELLQEIKKIRPKIHIKGFTAVELDYMFRKAKLSAKEGLQVLIDAGLNSIPGGGAEIFNESVREKICNDKVDAIGWLDIHKQAHVLGLKSNATILYGHIESIADRLEHLDNIRTLQDETQGFQAFIPLKFRNKHNDMQHVKESILVQDLKMYAMCRIYLDNVPHLKAYWPMLGRQNAQLTLDFGVNDLDGTIDDSTKIYSMAGSEEQHPALTTEQLVNLITQAGRTAVERDTLYNIIKKYSS